MPTMTKKTFQVFFLFLILLSFSSCNNRKNIPDGSAGKIEAKLNDSLSIVIYPNDKGNTIGTMIIKNSNSKVDYVYGFRDDGVTPIILGKEVNGKRDGIYLTYYSNGFLCTKSNFYEDELDGYTESFTPEGKIIYKAIYEHGVEKKVEICDSIALRPTIAPIKEEQ